MKSAVSVKKFQKTIWGYYRRHGRDFPWRKTRDPYHILVSEIMLQQTQVGRVERKFGEFLKQFPNFHTLAKTSTRDVLRAWRGLGYNRRALALKRTAKIVVEKYGGKLPRETDELVDLPGIGPGTAGAIRAFAFNLPSIFIETNIRRVFLCCFFSNKQGVSDDEVKALLERACPPRFSEGKSWREWYWALMDYGAMLGSPKRGEEGLGHRIENPNRRSKHYAKQSKFEGSNRQLRGQVLRILLQKEFSLKNLAKILQQPEEQVASIITKLKKEGFKF
ncbi:A/G-specific adenine glycosylase [Candidatus Giovannonibacteria bacterium]|nr:A/G-specific adenine glycosylase [Candidatus Giovannonibacteria bacterium]